MAVTYAKYRSGEYDKSDYTPGSAVSAGDVVIIGDVIGIAHLDIPADVMGTLGINGGLYDMPKDAAVLTPGALVYWDAVNHIVSLNNALPYFGKVDLVGALTGDTRVGVWHRDGTANIGT